MSTDNENTCACGGSCGCGGANAEETERVYLTREEYVARLEEYLGQLRAEIASVEQELIELREIA
jgi:hypothetical protein